MMHKIDLTQEINQEPKTYPSSDFMFIFSYIVMRISFLKPSTQRSNSTYKITEIRKTKGLTFKHAITLNLKITRV